jgi:TRAP-type C4-dicarboxylate transport system permease small subunit
MNNRDRLGKFEWFTSLLSSWFNWLATCGILVMMFVTLVDVVGAKLLGLPFPGAMEITQVTQVVVLAGALAFTQISSRHVRVELVTMRLPKRIRASINGFTSLVGLGLFILVAWGGFKLTQMFMTKGEVSGTILIPFYPFSFWLGLSSLLLCLVLLLEFICSVAEVFRR